MVLGDVTFDSVSPLPPVYKARRTGGEVKIDVLWTPDSEQATHGDYSATLIVRAEGEDSPLTSDTVRFTISSPTPTPTYSPTPTATPSPTNTPTSTATPTRTRTPTATWTSIPTRTIPAKPSSTPILFDTVTPAPTAWVTATHTSTATPAPTFTPTHTLTAIPMPIQTATQVPLLDASLSPITEAPSLTPTRTPVLGITANLIRSHSPQPAVQATRDGSQADTAPAATRMPEITVASVAPAPAPPRVNSTLVANSLPPTTNLASNSIQPTPVVPHNQPITRTDTPEAVRLYPTDPSRQLRIVVDPPPTVAPLHEPASNPISNGESSIERNNPASEILLMRIGSLLSFAIAAVAASALLEIWWRSKRAAIDGE